MRRLLLFLSLAAAAQGQNVSDHYKIESIEIPVGVVGEIGGLSMTPSGKLAVAFFREGVFFYDPKTRAWSHFAHGLHEPLGIHAVSEREVIVMQRPELTRLKDTNGDGAADEFETISDDFGMSGNYHEFAYGPAVGPDGALFIGLNTASSGDGIFKEVRGEFREDGRKGRMYACVPYRGWVLRVDPKTGETTPWASGFRSPNGLGFDAEGRLLVPDNQGDWVGTSPVHVVKRGAFHGHAASLVWTEGWDRGNPKDLPESELEKLRRRPAIQMPHGVLSNSPCQVIPDLTGGKFGPFAGQTFVGEMNHAHVIRIMLEEVAGEFQGAATTLIKGGGLPKGVNRFAFDANGALYVGHTKRDGGWGGGTGLNRITFTGEAPFDVLAMNLTEDGFRLTFTEDLDPATASEASFQFQSYYYEYHQKYGSDRFDAQPAPVRSLEVDGREVRVVLGEMRAGYVYDLAIAKGLKSKSGKSVLNPKIYYNCNRLLDGTTAPPQTTEARVIAKIDPAKMQVTPGTGLLFEAEDANLRGPSFQRNNAGFTGKGFADFQGRTGESVVWIIEIEEAGVYELNFRYAVAGGARPLKLRVNSKPEAGQQLPFEDSGSWTTWTIQSAQAELLRGRNVIQLDSFGASGPNVDSLEISPANAND